MRTLFNFIGAKKVFENQSEGLAEFPPTPPLPPSPSTALKSRHLPEALRAEHQRKMSFPF